MRVYVLLDGQPLNVNVGPGTYLAPVILTVAVAREGSEDVTLALDDRQLEQIENAVRAYRENKNAASGATLTAGMAG